MISLYLVWWHKSIYLSTKHNLYLCELKGLYRLGGGGPRTRECYRKLPSRRRKTMYQFTYFCFQRHSDTIPFSTSWQNSSTRDQNRVNFCKPWNTIHWKEIQASYKVHHTIIQTKRYLNCFSKQIHKYSLSPGMINQNLGSVAQNNIN